MLTCKIIMMAMFIIFMIIVMRKIINHLYVESICDIYYLKIVRDGADIERMHFIIKSKYDIMISYKIIIMLNYKLKKENDRRSL